MSALVVAVACAGVLVVAGGDRDRRTGPDAAPDAGPPPLSSRWPAARTSTTVGRLADGMSYVPALYLDVAVSIGTAPTPDRLAERLVLRGELGAERVLRQVPASVRPQFFGLTADRGHLYWVEVVQSAEGTASSIWRAPVTGGAPAAMVTADAGAGQFYDRQDDLVVADGAVHWVARREGGDTAMTELRSVPVAGGKVDIVTLDGDLLLTGWPWLTSRGRGTAAVVLVNAATGRRVAVPSSAAERVTCTPVWCRTTTALGADVARFELMQPDGSQRRQVGAATVLPATTEVAPLDRFEVVADRGGGTARLLLYGIDSRTFTLIAVGVGSAVTRQGMLWWSTGEQDAAEWHAVDLRTLTP
ncbi:hypothetical protein GCM10010532_037400 [Dactylosporangium siamense]|uniref:Uncharacterized protein n=1 Tax=Dactylosporangium siamense TaxID=685454 RepID=A0A919PK18_9ACTN|nr:hypothetical protein Dsi01nite_029830 [Dactylosporangium siamense]